MLVKICGIQDIKTGIVAAEAGADFLGFVFAKSKRQVTPELARDIIQELPASVKTVGVFVNETVERMKEIQAIAKLDYIQLHGDEEPHVSKSLQTNTIKAYPVTEESLHIIKNYPADFYLLDSPIGGARGGNGTTFDWDLATDLPIERSKIILAGGLNEANVREAIQRLHPIGVDVSSGVETNGQKDHAKIKRFIQIAKQNN